MLRRFATVLYVVLIDHNVECGRSILARCSMLCFSFLCVVLLGSDVLVPHNPRTKHETHNFLVLYICGKSDMGYYISHFLIHLDFSSNTRDLQIPPASQTLPPHGQQHSKTELTHFNFTTSNRIPINRPQYEYRSALVNQCKMKKCP